MSKHLRKYNNCKEEGPIGKRQETVLRENYKLLFSKIDPREIKDELVTVGILNPLDLEGIDTQERQVKHIMELVLNSGPDGFMKFMEALRAGGYGDLAADLEQQLEKTVIKEIKGSKDLCSSESPNNWNGFFSAISAFVQITQPQLSLNIGMSRTGNEPRNLHGSLGVMFGGHSCYNKQLFGENLKLT